MNWSKLEQKRQEALKTNQERTFWLSLKAIAERELNMKNETLQRWF